VNDKIKEYLEFGRVKLANQRQQEAQDKANAERLEQERWCESWQKLTDKVKEDLPEELHRHFSIYFSDRIDGDSSNWHREPGRAEVIEIRIEGLAPIRLHYDRVNGLWQRYTDLLVCYYYIPNGTGQVVEEWNSNHVKQGKSIGIALALAEEAWTEREALELSLKGEESEEAAWERKEINSRFSFNYDTQDELEKSNAAIRALVEFVTAANDRIRGNHNEAACSYAKAQQLWQKFEEETAILIKPQPASNGTYNGIET
jgi:hypothetical protein